MKYAPALFLFFLVTGGAWFFTVAKFANPYLRLCQEVERRIYLNQDEIRSWLNQCTARASLVKPWTARQLIVNDFKNHMVPESLSHLDLQEPQEADSFWTGESFDHGFTWRYLEKYILITAVIPGSSSEQAGLRALDLIESFNGAEINSTDLNKQGPFGILRENKKFTVNLKAKKYQRYQKIKFTKNPKRLLLHVNDFFNANLIQEMRDILLTTKASDIITLDFRENSGGDFALALSFLDLFICHRTRVGEIRRPRFSDGEVLEFNPQWSQEQQVHAVNISTKLNFYTRENSQCIKNPLEVLVSAETASTAELVADALKTQRQAQLYGEKTKGSLLVGVARAVEFLGPGYLLYVPEAAYYNAQGQLIEGRGVEPQHSRRYDLKDVLKGQDSYLKR